MTLQGRYRQLTKIDFVMDDRFYRIGMITKWYLPYYAGP
jgi:hypothetical protein